MEDYYITDELRDLCKWNNIPLELVNELIAIEKNSLWNTRDTSKPMVESVIRKYIK